MDGSEAAVPPGRKGKPWLEDEDRLLYDSFTAGQPLDVIASVHQRAQGGIRSRLQRLGLIDQYGEIVDPPPPFVALVRRRAMKPKTEEVSPVEAALKLAFAVTTPDGWQVEIKSNRPFDRGLLDRLDLMLKGAVETAPPV